MRVQSLQLTAETKPAAEETIPTGGKMDENGLKNMEKDGMVSFPVETRHPVDVAFGNTTPIKTIAVNMV